jgi:hypothetical protein
MLLDRLREYLEPSCGWQRGDGPQSSVDWGEARLPLFAVHWPTVHDESDFKDDVVYFALDEAWVSEAPQGAAVYTLAELEAIRSLAPAVIRLLHAAKRLGGIVLQNNGPVGHSLLEATRSVGATPIAV